ncbi:MAG: sugar ABC transporter permease, partial [Clostridia bacterium]|nr:sugar ABC transporter permease [Clostridia bacterium]
MKKKKIKDYSSVNSAQMRQSLRRYFPIFLLPMVAAFAIGFVWPFCQGLFLSFTKFQTTSKWTWVGIQNYLKIFQDQNFLYSFVYTSVFAIVSLVIINVLAFAVAYALTRKIKGANLFRTVFFMPN